MPETATHTVGMKKCTFCRCFLSLTTTHWHLNSATKDGFHTQCKGCRELIRKGRLATPGERTVARMKAKQKAEDALHSINHLTARTFHMTEIYEVSDMLGRLHGDLQEAIRTWQMNQEQL